MIGDIKRDPEFQSRLKQCTVNYEDPSGATQSDGWPVMLYDLVLCPVNAKCCGAPKEDDEGNLIAEEGCCNVLS